MTFEYTAVAIGVCGFFYAVFLGLQLKKSYKVVAIDLNKLEALRSVLSEGKKLHQEMEETLLHIKEQLKANTKEALELKQDYAYYLEKGEELLSRIDPAVHRLYEFKKEETSLRALSSSKAKILSPVFTKKAGE